LRLGNCGSGAAHAPSTMSMARRDALVQVFNQMHALIVGVGKSHCFKSDPDCEKCPLRKFLPRGASRNG
jgi:endonuclease III